jgi:hypothetical protein
MQSIVAQCERQDEQHKRELAGRHSRSEPLQTIAIAFGPDIPIPLARKSVGVRTSIQKETRMSEDIAKITGQFQGVSRAAFAAQSKNPSDCGFAVASPFPRSHPSFDPHTDDGGEYKSVLGIALDRLKKAQAENDPDDRAGHLQAAYEAVGRHLAKRDKGATAQRAVRFQR